MCGIAGIIHLDGAPAEAGGRDGQILRQLTRAIAHRGPDDEQLHFWQNVGLGFRRLSIVDPQGGRQPLFSEDGSVALICNGEIYNHRQLRARFADDMQFRSGSDCEIIPHLYRRLGIGLLEQLNGIFAFALLDTRERKLYLCRDRLGVKPLFYYRSDDLLVFGSEVKALLAHPAVPKQFDWQAALTFKDRLYYPHMRDELTSFFRGIRHLPAGCFLEIDLARGGTQERRYWDIDPADERPDRLGDRDTYVRRYGELLDEAVGLQLMADVGCGAFLSGGIDSVAVTHLAATRKPLQTFTVLSQSTLTNGDAPSAHAAARSCGLPNHMVLFDWRDMAVTPGLWRDILWKVEMPAAGAEQLYKYLLYGYARQAAPDLKVMLLGSGSDEFNGGYSKAVFNSPTDPSWQNFEHMLADYERGALLARSGAWSSYANVRSDGRMLIRSRFLAELADVRAHDVPWDGYTESYRRLLQMYQLWHEDRTSSAHGIEARVPFLDHRIVELTYAVPRELHADLFWDKTILRDALAGRVPDQFRLKQKTPFFHGEDLRYTRRLMYRLLCADGGALVAEALEENAEAADVIDRDALLHLIRTIPDDPEFEAVDMALDLVNMGLLAAMAEAPPEPSRISLPVRAVDIEDWAEWEQRAAANMVQRVPALDHGSVLRFAAGVCLVRFEAGDPRLAGETHNILRNGTVEFTLDGAGDHWLAFLREVDGARTVEELTRTTGVAEADIWKHLEEAVEYGVLETVPAAA